MTVAKPNLLRARQLLLEHLDMHPGRTVAADLDPVEVGIVADRNHTGGYHCGADRLYRTGGVLRDYSAIESPRDRRGLRTHPSWASAVDVGQFHVRVRGKAHTLRTFSLWVVAQMKGDAPDARDLREVIYSADGRTVRRYDRLGLRSGGDTSHLGHTHLSEFRDADGTNMLALFRRYLTEIGILTPEGDDDMPSLEEIRAAIREELYGPLPASKAINPAGVTGLGATWHTYQRTGRIERQLALARVDLAKALGRDPVNEELLGEAMWTRLAEQHVDDIERVLRAGLPPDKLAALAARLSS